MAQIVNVPNPSTQLASLLGRSLSTGLHGLAQQKLQQIQKNQQANQIGAGLQALGFDPERAQALSQMPLSLLNPLMRNYVDAKSGKSKLMRPNKLNSLLKLRSRLLPKQLSNPNSLKKYLSKSGLSDIEKELVTSTKLSNSLVDYFLEQANGNDIKAQQMAKRFGFKF